ncbi:helix-turn-helix domain-containing protein [Halalkalirubrum salinum]|uniref:helix-turn-helix domain-containing protein n=1 Tax=Halalkalirubrum salinum TaxID=2563889 RepID=UPI0010FAD269|nr:helix-turn-helix domain-containing protein [Halalkalirubrum salinum]
MSRSDGSETPADPKPAAIEDRDLRVVLEIERGGPCFMDDLAGDVIDIDVRVVNGTCHTEATVCEPSSSTNSTIDTSRANNIESDEDRVVTKYHTDEVCDHCPSSVFAAYGCIPHFVRADGRSFFIKAFLPNSAMVSNLVSDLNEIGSTVRLVSMTHTGSGEELSDEIYEVDVSALTHKQREALELAIEEGYYEGGERPSMASLADQLGISTSAFSQRLARAEGHVMGQFNG